MSRRRKRREGVALHPGVSLLEPDGTSRVYWVLKWKDAAGKICRKSTRLQNKGEARKMAIALSEQLREPDHDADLSWVDFTQRYEDEELGDAPKKTRQHWGTARGWYANLMVPTFLDEVNTSSFSRFVAALRKELERRHGRASATTIASYVKTLLAAFNWAHRLNLLQKPVTYKLPKRTRKAGGTRARSRAVTEVEFRQMVERAEVVRPKDYPQWQRQLWGYWLSGFRLRELLQLSWDETSPVAIVPHGKIHVVRFRPEGHKGAVAKDLVVPYDFWQLICKEPPVGHPFWPTNRKGQPCDPDHVGRVIARCGEEITTGIDSDKTATCHDIRRAWTDRWRPKLTQDELLDAGRWEDDETRRDYYHSSQLEALAEKLGWGKEE